jgi:hypothetical protein
MADADTRTETAPTAPPDLGEAAILSGLIELSAAMAKAFQAEAMAALQAGDLDRAIKAETRFSRLFLGIRRAIALKARLRQQQDEARRAAEQDQDDQLARAADRRRRVAQGVTGAIAAATSGATPADIETREQLTADLWDRLAGDHAGRFDRADRVLPIEDLIRSMCRDRRGDRRDGGGPRQDQGGDRRPCARGGLVWPGGSIRRQPASAEAAGTGQQLSWIGSNA